MAHRPQRLVGWRLLGLQGTYSANSCCRTVRAVSGGARRCGMSHCNAVATPRIDPLSLRLRLMNSIVPPPRERVTRTAEVCSDIHCRAGLNPLRPKPTAGRA